MLYGYAYHCHFSNPSHTGLDQEQETGTKRGLIILCYKNLLQTHTVTLREVVVLKRTL